MALIAAFNQMDFLRPVMRVDGWETALEEGCCTAISTYFVSLALRGANIVNINQAFDARRAEIAESQQNAINRHLIGMDGYGWLLQQVGLVWSGNSYQDPTGNLFPGQVALCLIDIPGGVPHMIGILYHQAEDLVYTFDPNLGVSQAPPQTWYEQFPIWVQQNYHQNAQVRFNNVALNPEE